MKAGEEPFALPHLPKCCALLNVREELQVSNSYLTVAEYISKYEPFFIDEIEIQAADLEPWMQERERRLDISPAFNEAGQRVYNIGLIDWAWNSCAVMTTA